MSFPRGWHGAKTETVAGPPASVQQGMATHDLFVTATGKIRWIGTVVQSAQTARQSAWGKSPPPDMPSSAVLVKATTLRLRSGSTNQEWP